MSRGSDSNKKETFHLNFTSVGKGEYTLRVESGTRWAEQPCDLSADSIGRWLAAAKVRIPDDREVWRSGGGGSFDQALEKIRGDFDDLGSLMSKQGGALYRAVFSGEALLLYHECLGKAQVTGQPLAIVLHFDLEDPIQARLATLAWEQLYDPEQKRYLAQGPETSVVRFLKSRDKVRPARLPQVLRVLAVTSAPSDLPKLDLSSAAKLVGDWPQANIVVTHVADPDIRTLKEALKNVDILHFDGHGQSDLGTGVGALALVGDDGKQELLSGPELGKWLGDSPRLRLVVLNACSTGVDVGKRAFTGVASALVRAGVAAVVAMRRPIQDDHAIVFARMLYGDLTRGRSLQAALSTARQELATYPSDDWATPALFASTDDVFEIPIDIRPTLTRVFSWLGLLTATVAVNAWSRNRGGPSIPGFSFGNVHSESVPIFGILIVAPLLLLVQTIILRFQSQAPDRGLFFRLPIAFDLEIQNNRTVANFYQGLMLFGLVFVPLASQFQFLQRIHDGASWHLTEPHDIVTRGWEHLQHYEPPGFLYFHDEFRFGPRKNGGKRNFSCREGEICEVSFFPFWQPWAYLVVTLLNLTLFILIVVGIWDRDPLRWRMYLWRRKILLRVVFFIAVAMTLAALTNNPEKEEGRKQTNFSAPRESIGITGFQSIVSRGELQTVGRTKFKI